MGCGSSKGQNVAHNYSLNDFPTPDQLAHFQRTYKNTDKKQKANTENTKTNVNTKDQKESVADAARPRPSSIAKSQIFKPSEYNQVDQRAQKAPINIAAQSYSVLVSYLTQVAKNDVGKARAFYVWIASQRLQPLLDYSKKNDVSKESPLYMMLHVLVKQWGNGYSELFRRLCVHANLKCIIVKGRVKGSGYKIGEKYQTTNDWCIVELAGRWGIVDQHWGSLFVVGNVYNSDWDMLKDADENDNAATAKEEETCQICDDFYFLPNPEAIIFTHMALAPKYQLLARPVTEAEFWQMAVLKDAFFEMEMTTISHPKCVVNSDQKGQVIFLFGLPRNRQCLFRYNLLKSAFDEKANLVNGVSIERYVIMQKIKDILKITIHFPKIGKYKFDLYGKEKKSKSGFQVVAEYAINCQKPDLRFEPLPENTRSEWGPGQDTSKLGLEPLDNDNGIIYAKEGKATVGFKMTEVKDLQYQSNLINAANKKENLNDCIRHYTQDDKVRFLMKLPQNGNYILELNAKNANEKKYSSICNYLIKSDQGCYDLAPYPESDNKTGQTGAVIHGLSDLKLTPMSHKEAIIDPLTSKSEIKIQMKTNKPDYEYKAHMKKYYSVDNEVEDESNYLNFQHKKENLYMLANFPEVGFYKLDILTKNKLVYQYLINVQKPNVDCVPFPKQLAGWKSEFEIIEPKKSYLPANKRTDFKFIIPRAKKARLECNGVTKDLVNSKENQDLFGGEFLTPSEGGLVTLKADFGSEKPNQAMPLLAYTVVGGQLKREIDKKNEEAEKRAEEHLKDMEEQKEMEEKMMMRKQKEEDVRIKLLEDDFKKNKEKYEKEEMLMQKKETEKERLVSEGKTDEDNRDNKENGHHGSRPRNEVHAKEKAIVVVPTKPHSYRDYDDDDDREATKPKSKQRDDDDDEDDDEEKKPTKIGKPRSSNTRTEEHPKRKSIPDEEMTPPKQREASPKTWRSPDSKDQKASPITHSDVLVKTASQNSDFEPKHKEAYDKEDKYSKTNRYEGSDTTRSSTNQDDFDLKEEKHLYRVDGNEDWKKYHPKLTNSIALERLRDCMRKRDKTMLESAIDTCHDSGLRDNREVKNAAVTLQALQARRKLDKAVESRDPAAIRRELDNIQGTGLTRFLQHESREANYVLEALERPSHLHKNVLNMDHKTMSEVRRYKNPPPMFLKIMQATFLLLGEDEESTSTWKDVQRLCNPQGVNGMNRRILNFDAEKVHPEIVARSDQILRDVDVDKVRAVSPGAGTFYVWSKGAIDECKSLRDVSKVRPANKERQREIFDRTGEADPLRNGGGTARWL